MVDTAAVDSTPIQVKLMDNAYYNYTGDRSTFSNGYKNGGNGFTGGGAGSSNVVFGPTAAGGGGGFSGGSVNYYFGGGGGSSHVASGVNTSSVNISPGSSGANGHNDGYIQLTANTAPIITQASCQNQTVQLNANGQASLTASQLNNGSTGFVPLTYTVNGQPSLNFTCADVGTMGVTMTLTDAYGTTSTCTATITIQDNVAPTATCQDVTVQLNASGNAFINTCEVDTGSNDACGGFVGVTLNQTTFNCNDIGSNSITMTVTDVNGNTGTCTSTVTVQDQVNPVASCKNVTVQLDGTGNGSLTAAMVDNGSSDVCGIATYALDQYTFDCTDLGANTVTLSVMDQNGNTASCLATVTVQDNISPVASCQNATVQLDANGSASLTAGQIDNNSSDNCTITNRSLSQVAFSCSDIGNRTVTLTVANSSGQSNTCTATVSVVDAMMPTAACKDITVQLDVTGQVTVDANAFDNGSMDNCSLSRLYFPDFSVLKNFACEHVGTIDYANTMVVDNAGNISYCNVSLTIEDDQAPTANCANTTIQLDAAGQASLPADAINSGSSDACSIASFTVNQNAFDCTQLGPNTVTLSVTDANGNTNTCTATVTVEDNMMPNAVCKDVTVQVNGVNTVSILAADIWDDIASTDNCGSVTPSGLTPTEVTCSQLGSVVPVTLTVSDGNGNSSQCTANVTVAGFPCGWGTSTDGINCPDGNDASFDPDTGNFIITSDGCYDPAFQSTTDLHGYIGTELCGDGEIIAEVSVSGNGFAGISMRETLLPGAKLIQLAVSNVGTTKRDLRQTTGGLAYSHLFQTGGKNWLKLTRTGNMFGAYHSSDGTNWSPVLVTQISMANCIEIGLITENSTPTGTVTGTFENVQVNNIASLVAPSDNPGAGFDLEGDDAVMVYPNPTSGETFVEMGDYLGKKVSLMIYDGAGKALQFIEIDKLQEPTQRIDLNDYETGTYYISIQVDDQPEVTKKVIFTRS